MTRPLAPVGRRDRDRPVPSDEERAVDRRFIVRLVAATVALQLVGGLLVAGLTPHRGHFGGAPPMPSPPIRGGAIDVRSK